MNLYEMPIFMDVVLLSKSVFTKLFKDPGIVIIYSTLGTKSLDP
jgi:hypothetical protein